ncbi:hypothetical protein [Natrinema sp. 74]|uniref:hypothetical protein n=1 Tax=Natrinema sp. 74 TaxID=3384159 RepID=UPI0038D412BE
MEGEQTELPIEPGTVRERYRDFAAEIERRETSLQSDVPIEEPYGVSEPLYRLSERWDQSEKSLRTTSVLNVYHHSSDPADLQALEPVLLGLDATINVLDDIIDTRQLEPDEKLDLTITTAFSNAYALGNIPPRHLSDVLQRYYEYLVKLFQIPRVEERLLEQFTHAETRRERLKTAEEIYAYRSMDMTIFAQIPAQILDLEAENADRLISDLKSYRARRLLFKDLADTKRDLRDHDETPVLALLQNSADPHRIREFLLELVGSFPYSATGRDHYADSLRTLERRPADLTATIERRIREVKTDAI